MALKLAIQTAFEILVVVLIIYGFVKEDKLIEFEDRLKEKIKKGAKTRARELNTSLAFTKMKGRG